MDKIQDVVVIVGSLRNDSINRKVAHALAELAPSGLKLSIVEIGQLPIYNQDGDENPPPEWTAFRERIAAADAVLFVTPEHNRSVPAALKNALDVGSRPYGKNVWNGKPGAVVTASPGGIGGFLPLEKLLMLKPDYVVLKDAPREATDQGALYLTHPALRGAYPQDKRIRLPARYALCGGPSLIAAMNYLEGELKRLR